MNGSVNEWVAKSEGDFDIAQLALRPSWTPVEKEFRFLAQGAILFRYPGESATRAQADRAIAICTGLRESLLKLVGSE